MEGEVKHQEHNAQEKGNGGIPVGEDGVDTHASPVLPALMGLHHRLRRHLLNEVVPHGGQGRVPVHAGVVLHLNDGVLQELPLVLPQLQHLQEGLVPLNELRGTEPGGDPRPLGMVLDEVGHGVNAPVHRTDRTKIHHLGQNPFFGHPDKLPGQLRDALVLGCTDGHHRNAQGLRHFLDIHRAPVACQLIHHIEGHHCGNAKLQQLQSQV